MQRSRAVFDQAMQDGLWKGEYAANNHHEYWPGHVVKEGDDQKRDRQQRAGGHR